MAKKARRNPYAAFNFVVSSNGLEIGGFMEVSGLDTENAVIEYREGHDQKQKSDGAFVRKQPGLERYPNVMMRRGITGDLKLWDDLRKKIRDADPTSPEFLAANATPRVMKIELQDESHDTVQSWTLQNAWVAKMSGPSLNAKSNEIAIESIEVVCERIDLI